MSRTRLALFAAGTVALGLASRPLKALSPALGDALGDACWASLVFWLLSALRPRSPVQRRGAVALGIAYAVEASQLYHTPWLDTIRRTTLGHLMLGWGFDPRDLLWYALGVGVGLALSVRPEPDGT